MKAGETLQFSSSVVATGKDLTGSERVNWTVSSTEDGKGSVTSGTSISPSGLLKVSVDEIYPVIWVKAASAAYSRVYDFRQLQISGPKVGSVTLTSAGNAASVPAGGTLKFTAVAAGRGPNQGITFSVGSVTGATGPVAAGTSIASDGTLTVAAGETANSLFVRAVSETDTTKTDTKEVKVVTVTGVTVTADGGIVKVVRGGSLQFSASVSGNNSPPNTVTWKVSAGTSAVTAGTSIDSNGMLRVASDEAAATLFITATSTINTAKSGAITVVIPTVTGVVINPASPQIKRGDGLSFKATVQGTGGPGQEVTWTVEGIGGDMTGSTMTGNGILTVTINEMLSRLLVTATSVDDPTKSGTATVTIAASPAGVPPVEPSYDDEADFATSEISGGAAIQILKYKGSNTVVRIPAKIGGKPVTTIGASSFKDNKTITSVIIPTGVTTIGREAFGGCENLASVSIPNTVTTIEWFAFNRAAFTSVTIPASVRTLNGFTYCKNLTSVTIQPGVTTIGSQAFSGCTSLTSITLPNSVTLIEYDAFKSSGLTSITIPNSVTTIHSSVFESCAELTSLTLGTGIKSLSGNMTQFCQKLSRITFLGTIPVSGFKSFGVFYGDLQSKFYATDKANGTPGTYVADKLPVNNFSTWTKQ
jgi:hypothetical protein